jgi:hypothetical protein
MDIIGYLLISTGMVSEVNKLAHTRLLNPRIASTWITAETSGGDGSHFDLSLFASCGKAPVHLQGEDFSAKCLMWLTGATLQIDFEGCLVTLNSECLRASAPTYIHEKSTGDLSAPTTTDPTKLGVSIAPVKGEFSADIQHSFQETSPKENEYTKHSLHRQWEMIGPQTLLLDANQSTLRGMIVPGVKAWKVEPLSDANRSKVIAQLFAEEEFCKFELQPGTAIGERFGGSVRAFFTTASAKQKRMFSALLQTLASKGLVSNQSTSALLADFSLAFDGDKKTTFEHRNHTIPTLDHTISIDSEPLFYFVQSNSNQRLKLLENYGVSIIEFVDFESNPRERQESLEEPALASSLDEKPLAKSQRRKPSKGFDFLLLDAIQQKEEARVISQDYLFRLAKAFDPSSKRPSLISKLVRWRNSLEYLEWRSPEDIQITDRGKHAAANLKKYLSDEEFNRIKAAHKNV